MATYSLPAVPRARDHSLAEMMAMGALPGLVLASAVTLDFGVLGIIGGLITAVVGAWAVYRKVEPQRAKLKAEADRLASEADEIEERIRKSLLDGIEEDRQLARAMTAEARADAAQARAESAELAAEMAHRFAAWEAEKITYERRLNEKDKLITRLERKVDALEQEVRNLRLEANFEAGRRQDDRLGALETRADAAAADRASLHTADDEQRHRNDDTEGHA